MSIETVKFRGRHVPSGGIAAIVLGGLAIIILAVLCLIEAFEGTKTGLPGLVAMTAALVSVTGLAWSVVSYYERDIFAGIPIAGMIVNGLSVIMYAFVFFLGNA